MAYDSAVGVCSVSMASSHERRLAARPVQHVVTHRKKKKIDSLACSCIAVLPCTAQMTMKTAQSPDLAPPVLTLVYWNLCLSRYVTTQPPARPCHACACLEQVRLWLLPLALTLLLTLWVLLLL